MNPITFLRVGLGACRALDKAPEHDFSGVLKFWFLWNNERNGDSFS